MTKLATFKLQKKDGEAGEELKVDLLASRPPENFLQKIWDAIKETYEDGGWPYHFFDPVGKEVLSQFWSMRQLDDTERGPIYLGKDSTNRVRNWAGNQQYEFSSEITPENLTQVKEAIAAAYKSNQHVTVVGGAYGSSPLVSTRGTIINTEKLDKIIDFNAGKNTIKVEAGIPIIKIIQKLYENEKILPTTPIFAKMAAGGGAAVGIHGTGKDFQTLCDYMVEMEVINVNENGEVEMKAYNSTDNPDEMKALKVNLGALGFVYSITYSIIDVFNLEAVDEHVEWPATEDELEAFIKNLVLSNEYVELFWWPLTKNFWVKKWNKTTEPADSDASRKLADIAQYWASYATYAVLFLLSTFPQWTGHIMQFLAEMSLPHSTRIVAKANHIYNYLVAVPPKHWDLNQCINIPQQADGDYNFKAIASAHTQIRNLIESEAKEGRYPINSTLHTRFISNSDAYLSPINGNSYSAMSEIVTFNITRDWLSFFKQAEQIWRKLDGRPHWGKLILQLPPRDAWGNGTGVQDFLRIKSQMDPKNLFRNDFHYDVFERRIPKMMDIKINAVHPNFADIVSMGLGSILKDLFHLNRFSVVIETATDHRQTSSSKSKTINEKFNNVNFTDFVQLQLLINGKLAGTGVFHLQLYNDLAPGQTTKLSLDLHPNWFTKSNLGTIDLEITPVNYLVHNSRTGFEEAVSIIATNKDDDHWISALRWAEDSVSAGFKVYIGVEASDVDAADKPLIPGAHVVTVAEAAAASPVVVFACPNNRIKDFVEAAGKLEHKLVIDATSYHTHDLHNHEHVAADHHDQDINYKKVFGPEITVAKVVDHAIGDGADERVIMFVAADDAGTRTAVMSWVTAMGLESQDIGNLAHASVHLSALAKLRQFGKNARDKVVHTLHHTECSLPESDDLAARASKIVATRSKYTYDTEYFKDCSIPNTFPFWHVDWASSPSYLAKIIGTLIKHPAYYALWERLTLHTSDSLAGYAPMNIFGQAHFEGDSKTWCPDESLGNSRLAGPDPRGIVRVKAVSEFPVNFPITQEVFATATGGKTLEQEIAQGNVFIVNYKILEMFANKHEDHRWVCAPIAVFLWSDLQMLPILIQLNQDPAKSPIINKTEELTWEAAKVYFQNATAQVHAMCAHEYDEHVVMGAFSMATPRNLAENHPVYVLLQPHLQFTVAHAAKKNASMRINIQGGFFSLDSDMARDLVTAYSHDAKFYKLGFDTNIRERGVEQFPPVGYYPYRDDGFLMWEAITSFVSDYIDLYYLNDVSVANDTEIQAWYGELGAQDGGRLHGLLESDADHLTNKVDLKRILTTVIFLAGPHHAITHFSQNEYMLDPLHILPGQTRQEWPVDPKNPQDFHAILPDKGTSCTQAAVFSSGDMQYDSFGDYKGYPLNQIALAQAAITKFRENLLVVDKTIQERETRGRSLPYPYFRPTKVPNATNI